MNSYYFNEFGFNIKNFNQAKPFANFLPGVAGKMGIPLWVFYVNRGQCIASFGLQDKNHPIMPFTPANKAYESTPISGFRTFIKVNQEYYEPFHIESSYEHTMTINHSSFSITEKNDALGLEVSIDYYGLPNEPIAGLVRKVQVKNTSSKPQDIELLDGISEILSAGIQNGAYKSISNLLSSWIDVEYLDKDYAFYTLRGSTSDTSEVSNVEEGNFLIGFYDNKKVKPIVDPSIVFSYNTAKTKPAGFIASNIDSVTKLPQVTTNQIPCGFIPIKKILKPQETMTYYIISGHVKHHNILEDIIPTFEKHGYFDTKFKEMINITETLLEDVETSSNEPIFDAYIKQNYLDNFLRGGYPISIGNSIYHLYSRRHGDLERDYNFFSLAPEYYSQGAGNFRDVCQNRRLDSIIHPEVKDFNVYQFLNLIQLDGYNPLSVNGVIFKIEDENIRIKLINQLFDSHKEALNTFLSNYFTPGNIVNFIEQHHVKTLVEQKVYLEEIINTSRSEISAAFGEGYWVDHFTYVLDLIESYEKIYPDTMTSFLYEDSKYMYFESPVSVLPQEDKIVINGNTQIRQYDSLRHYDDEKVKRLNLNVHGSNWSQIGSQVYTSNLFTKLLTLVLTKHSLLDPEGIGIEMEANKPGWNDAMNGLPGLIGSGVSESIELLRIIQFLLKYSRDGSFTLPEEIYLLFNGLKMLPDYNLRLKNRHSYRESIRFGLSENQKTLTYASVFNYLAQLEEYFIKTIISLSEEYQNIIPTFLYYEVNEYEPYIQDGNPKLSLSGKPLAKPMSFKRKALPNFLEAPARLLKTKLPKSLLQTMHQNIQDSDLYDQKLKFYKTSVCIEDAPYEIGRIHAFTKGWLERESNFLHMTYKYLLGLLKAGLYEEYYEALETNLVCFMDPHVYGRSTLENSSFIVPSNNPNPAIHGQGFFARLSGSTIEALTMWDEMMTGGTPFRYIDSELCFTLEPKIHHKFFKQDGTLSFTFLKDITVTYYNPLKKNTYDLEGFSKIELINDRENIVLTETKLQGEIAHSIRAKRFTKINAYY